MTSSHRRTPIKHNQKIGGGFNKREPTDTKRIRLQPIFVDIFKNHRWLGSFELLKGYDDEVARDFAMDFHSQVDDSSTAVIRGLVITITPDLISRVTTLPLGIKWNREDRVTSVVAMKSLFFPNEEHIKEKNGVRRESLP